MNITTISYSESHEQFSEYGLKLWRKAGIEAELSEGDDPGKSYDELEKIVKTRLTSNPPPESVPLPVEQIKKEPKEAAIDSQIEAIAGCTSIKSLEIFKKLVDRENVPRLTEAYFKKSQILTNGLEQS